MLLDNPAWQQEASHVEDTVQVQEPDPVQSPNRLTNAIVSKTKPDLPQPEAEQGFQSPTHEKLIKTNRSNVEMRETQAQAPIESTGQIDPRVLLTSSQTVIPVKPIRPTPDGKSHAALGQLPGGQQEGARQRRTSE